MPCYGDVIEDYGTPWAPPPERATIADQIEFSWRGGKPSDYCCCGQCMDWEDHEGTTNKDFAHTIDDLWEQYDDEYEEIEIVNWRQGPYREAQNIFAELEAETVE